ncbi:MAG: Spy/CpxP family protein refolding chaperone [Candidatus Omnitrophica bacterium]|nr:Spy/CpxP family protein refolding chaperone [Candidatus Omnitrophota bacterium]
MKKMISVAMVLFTAVAVFTSGIYAFDKGCDGEKTHMGKKWESLTKELGLTPEQDQKLEANRKAQFDKMKDLRKAMKEKRGELSKALENPAATRSSVEPIIAEMKALESQSVDQRIDGIFSVKEILTPGQFAKFNSLMEKKRLEHKGPGKDKSGHRERGSGF